MVPASAVHKSGRANSGTTTILHQVDGSGRSNRLPATGILILMHDDLAELLPVSVAARELRLSAQRVRVLIDQGHLPAIRTPLGRLVRREDVVRFRARRDQFGRYRVSEATDGQAP